MNEEALKIKKIDSLLSQKIRDVYKYKLEHQLDNISYQLSGHTLVIVLEGIITTPEKLLTDNDNIYLAQQVRAEIDNVIHLQIQKIVEEILDVKIMDFISDTSIHRNLTGAIAVLEFKSNYTLDDYKS
ncbi:Na-translocating system protein MpsC family protein [Pleurocapsa sp. PCC 7319]|uniref:Na-translocating system protein MpsC family protein n=1 Tax=Pleurocapsa sp. PCC 7319 TaxID=118161 RepID=UPI00034AA90E|nr:Na-translocating system protein MpsC family protein [Pleurocapsa sp. PCC 7319]